MEHVHKIIMELCNVYGLDVDDGWNIAFQIDGLRKSYIKNCD